MVDFDYVKPGPTSGEDKGYGRTVEMAPPAQFLNTWVMRSELGHRLYKVCAKSSHLRATCCIMLKLWGARFVGMGGGFWLLIGATWVFFKKNSIC